jgi:hypothetical protein
MLVKNWMSKALVVNVKSLKCSKTKSDEFPSLGGRG